MEPFSAYNFRLMSPVAGLVGGAPDALTYKTCSMDADNHPLDVLDRLGPEWEKAVRDLHASGWRQ